MSKVQGSRVQVLFPKSASYSACIVAFQSGSNRALVVVVGSDFTLKVQLDSKAVCNGRFGSCYHRMCICGKRYACIG